MEDGLLKWLAAALASVVAWFGLDLHRRMRDLEKERVTRDDFDELRTSMMATFTHGHATLREALVQQSEARMEQHQENRETLIRMEEKMDANEDRAAKTRHDTFDAVHAIALKVAALRNPG